MPKATEISGTAESSILDHYPMPPSIYTCTECCILLHSQVILDGYLILTACEHTII